MKIIHEADQFIQSIPALKFELQYKIDSNGYDYWSTTVKLTKTITDYDGKKPTASSHWGEDGKYLYWYCLWDDNTQHCKNDYDKYLNNMCKK